MPIDKDLKRLVRRRMEKTGESYTAARTQLLRNKTATPKPTAAKPTATIPIANYGKLAGMSDPAVKAATGCDWQRWVGALDYVGAREWPHRKIAAYVHEKFEIEDWWAQTVAVGYERIRGLREIGQRRDGTYEATKSRTFAVPVTDLFKAFTQPRTRARWLGKVDLTVRRATANRSLRFTWDDGTPVEVVFLSKGEAKSSAQIAHTKLPQRQAATRLKEFWSQRLDSLEEMLTRGARRRSRKPA